MNQTHSASAKTQKKDYTVLKTMCALGLLVVSLFALKLIGGFVTTLEGFEKVLSLASAGWIVCLALAVISAVGCILLKPSALRTAAAYVLPVSLLWTFSFLILKTFLGDQMQLLYFAHTTVYCLYIIFMLYRTEFTLVSLMTILAGWTFYRYYPLGRFTSRILICTLLLAAAMAVSVLSAFFANKSRGVIRIGGTKLHLFPKSFSPMFLYVTAGIWAVCLLASLLVGSLFAYYCLFAAIALELIAAVYYTFQLK